MALHCACSHPKRRLTEQGSGTGLLGHWVAYAAVKPKAAPENSTPRIPLPSPWNLTTLGAPRTVPIQQQKFPPLCGAFVWHMQALLGGERCQPELKMLSIKAWTSGALRSNANRPQLPGMPKSDNSQVALKYNVVKTAKNSSTSVIA